MARVPQYDGAQVRSTALQPVQQREIDVSSGLRAVGQTVGALGDVADKLARRDADTEAWNAQAAIASEFETWDRETRKTAQGVNSKGYTAKVDEWWTKVRDERFGSLSPLAQQSAAKSLAQARLAALRAAGSYEDQQLDVGEKQALSSRIVTGVSAAAAAGAGRADPLIATLTEEIRAFGKKKGIDVEGQVLQTTTGIHANIIAGMLRNKDIKGAEEYFTLKKGEIDGTRHDEIAKGLSAGGTVIKAQTFGDEVQAKKMTLEQALTEARARFTGDEETAAVQEVKTRFAEGEAVQQRQAKDVTKTAWRQVIEGGSISRIEPSVYADLMRLAPEEKRQMQDWLDARRRQAKAEAEGNHDPDEFGRFYSYFRMAMEAPAKFADLDLTKVQPYVSKHQLASLISLQSGISKTDAKAMALQNQVKQTLTMVDSTIRASGLNPRAKPDTPAAKEFDNFMGAVTMALTTAQAERKDGTPLPPEEMRKIGMRLLQEGYEQGSGIFGMFQNTKRGYQVLTDPALAGKDFITTPYKKIPPAIRADLEKSYDAKNGRGGIYGNAAEREAAIERAYQRGLDEGRFR